MQKSQNTEEFKQQIVLACHKLYARGLVANHDGNITYRLDNGYLLATPTAFSKGDVDVSDILTLDPTGKVVDGSHKVFSEIAWHRAIYRVRPDVRCVVHGHPPAASAFGLARKDIGIPALPEAIVSLGRHILTARFFSPLDPEMAKAGGDFDSEIRRVLAESDAFVACGNGAWSAGQEILQTYYRLELVEHVALQHTQGASLGPVVGLPSALVDELVKRRPKPQTQKPGDAIPGTRAGTSAALGRLQEIVRHELQEILKA